MNLLKSFNFWLLVIPFLLWMYCFRFYLTGQGELIADAVSYYEHIGFFTDSLAQGQYPLWDPFCFEGASYQFFLQRIGQFNPFYLVMVLLKIVGVKHTVAYPIFLIFYYACSMLGFYLLVRYLLKNEAMAYIAYLILLFSSWGTQLFYNYIILLFLPLVWFFYFLIRFIHEFKPYQWTGMCLCLGLVLTTYIPFYFIFILLLFTLVASLLYAPALIPMMKQWVSFILRHRWLVIVSAVFLLMACLPSYALYQESKQGEFSMPARGVGAQEMSAVAVSLHKVESGDLINNSSFDKFFGGLGGMRLGDFYIPYVFLFLVLVSLFARMNRLIITTFLMMIVLLLISITQSSALHQWLYKHLFIFKFIRNIYYFFWLALVPLSVLWVSACLASLCDELPSLRKLLNQAPYRLVFYICVVLATVPQSMWVYHHLTDNMRLGAQPLRYEKRPYQNFKFRPESTSEGIVSSVTEKEIKGLQQPLHYANRWYAQLRANMDLFQLSRFAAHPLRLIDNVQPLGEKNVPWESIEKVMREELNTAFISHPQLKPEDIKTLNPQVTHHQPVNFKDERARWLRFDPNTIVLATHLQSEKFLLVTNNFHSQWRAYVNGKPVKLFRANYAFQGVWLPAGDAIVTFKFERWFTFVWHWLLLGAFTGCLFCLVLLWVRDHGKK